MVGDRYVTLRAENLERNVNRLWTCSIERDLFGLWIVSVSFGRAGTAGRTIKRMVPDDAAADRFLAGALARRRGAEKRCGAAYRVIEAHGLDGKLNSF
jgi:predicted DNA-binding WGR domain protein